MPTFPTVAILDSFKRANEAPLSNGGKWTQFAQKNPEQAEVFNEALQVTEAPEIEPAYYWNVKEFKAPMGIAIHPIQLNFEEKEAEVKLFVALSEFSGELFSGYEFRIEGRLHHEEEIHLELNRRDKGGETALEFSSYGPFIVGVDLLGLSVQEDKVIGWVKHAAEAWEVIPGYEIADATYTQGYIGIGLGNENTEETALVRIVDFEGPSECVHPGEDATWELYEPPSPIVQPGDAIISAATGRILVNVEGKLHVLGHLNKTTGKFEFP